MALNNETQHRLYQEINRELETLLHHQPTLIRISSDLINLSKGTTVDTNAVRLRELAKVFTLISSDIQVLKEIALSR